MATAGKGGLGQEEAGCSAPSTCFITSGSKGPSVEGKEAEEIMTDSKLTQAG